MRMPDQDRELLELIRRFGREKVAPIVGEYDRQERLPLHVLETMGDLGLYGGVIPEEYGGAGLSHVLFSRVIEVLSYYDHILGVLASMPSALVGGSLLAYGTEEQKRRWLTPLASGEIYGAAGVTEPHSGTDVAGLHTTYERTAGGYRINGNKAWISNLDIASFFVTFATRDRSEGKYGITGFVIPADTRGVSWHPYKNKLSFRPLCTGDLVLEDVEVGEEAVLGAPGEGYAVAMHAVEQGRLAVASRAVGVAHAAMVHASNYAAQRKVWGRSIDQFQMVQRRLADMAVEVAAARQLTLACAQEMDDGGRARVAASMAKMYASEVAERVASSAVQIHGAYGISDEYAVGRLYRDAKALQIVEGTNDIHRVLVAKSMSGMEL